MEEKLLSYVKSYMKLDDEDEEDTLVSSLILSSKIYLSNAGVKVDENNELHKLAIAMLTSQRYEDRLGKLTSNNNFIINSLITQISR
jgi:uncharacterized phage protein (predicted DNA packaging)